MVSTIVLISFCRTTLGHKKNKVDNIWNSQSRDFDFLQKGLGLPSPPHFVYDFSHVISLIL